MRYLYLILLCTLCTDNLQAEANATIDPCLQGAAYQVTFAVSGSCFSGSIVCWSDTTLRF